MTIQLLAEIAVLKEQKAALIAEVERFQAENATLKRALEFACTALEGEESCGNDEEYYEGFIERAKERESE